MGSFLSNDLGTLLTLDMGIQVAGWALAATLKTEKFYDLTGSLSFILLSYLSHSWSRQTVRQFVQSHMVIAWATRLGLYLFLRVIKDGGDRRFDQAKEEPMKFLLFWSMPRYYLCCTFSRGKINPINFLGVWVFVTILPTLMLNATERDVPIGYRDYLGWSLWMIGMLLETTADLQKSLFRNNPDNKGKFINSGLWSLCRHPNYLGEILLWFGLYFSASSVFRGRQFLAVLSPVFVHLLITRISGIPSLEASANKRWGHLPEYQQYVLNTPSLIPFTKWY